MSQPATPSRRLVIAPGSAVDIHGMPLPHQFPPIYKNLPEFTASDPHGILPIRRRIQATKGLVLEWTNQDKCLIPWFWPVEGGRRVPPSDFAEHRRIHNFRYPGCLCSVHELDPQHFVESAVFMVRSGTLSGEYVAACARNICKYWVLLERMYQKRSQPVRQYPLRDPNMAPPAELPRDGPEEVPSSVISTPSIDGFSPLRPLRRVWSDASEDSTPLPRRRRLSQSSRTAVAGSSPVNPFIVPYATPEPLPVPSSLFSILLQLDASSNPGLTETQFKKLFVRCSACKLYTTTSAFDDHNCRSSTILATEVIDLTADD
ncbi:hypothetical protein B0H14DRAFT_3859030 [Mycena olivaceomarginata]|nr:hypothetical protein B0H14DRAFT_3859030 [Mycena olivaceomarginata]